MFHPRYSIVARLFSLLVVLASSLSAAELPMACHTPETLLPSDLHRHDEGLVGESRCYRLDLVSPGFVSFDLSVASWLPAGAHFEIYRADGLRAESSNSRRVADAGGFEVLARTAESQLGILDPGTYYLDVVGDDPRRPLPAYRFRAAFLELNKSETDGELELEPEMLGVGGGIRCKSETDGELELEPEMLGVGGSLRCKSETDGELELEPEMLGVGVGIHCKSETDGELELEPEMLNAVSDLAEAVGRSLCAASDGDDHGDTFACATPVKHRVEGELGNGWGDDSDVFRFEVRGWQTVEIATEGDVDTFGTLYDRFGQRLAGVGDSGDDGNFHLVRTFRPGTYFVRVEGEHSTGSFALRIRAFDR